MYSIKSPTNNILFIIIYNPTSHGGLFYMNDKRRSFTEYIQKKTLNKKNGLNKIKIVTKSLIH